MSTPNRPTEMESGHSDTVTDGIRVRVAAQYVPDHSDPERNEYLYAYKVILSNEGTRSARLLSRHWIILDAHNDTREVRGPGVVGEQPELKPGASFEYMSRCPLRTEWGTMEGSYRFVREDGTLFDARIGRFFLARTVAPLSALSTR
jgi:ApaG protein